MRLIGKTVIFALMFSVVFFLLRTADFTGTIIRADLDDLGGILWLYSAVCLIFSILAGFIIQHEWDQWNVLVEAVNGEVSALQHCDCGRSMCPIFRRPCTRRFGDT